MTKTLPFAQAPFLLLNVNEKVIFVIKHHPCRCCFFGHFSVPWMLAQEAPLSSAFVTALTDKNRPFRLECYQINVFALDDPSPQVLSFPA